MIEAEGIVLTPEQKRRQRGRSVAIAAILVGLVVLFFVVTVVKIGGNIESRPPVAAEGANPS